MTLRVRQQRWKKAAPPKEKSEAEVAAIFEATRERTFPEGHREAVARQLLGERAVTDQRKGQANREREAELQRLGPSQPFKEQLSKQRQHLRDIEHVNTV